MNKGKTVGQKMRKMDLRKIGVAVLATILVVAMVIGLIPNETAQVIAADKTADLSTVTKYTQSLGDNASTEYAGRIWTDKTVYSDDSVSLQVYGGGTETIENTSDFLVGFSALATSQSISGEEQAPIDVVFIIDISGSMSNSDSNMTNSAGDTYSRIKYTVDAVNNAIDDLMALNDYTRVAVVGFSSSAVTLLPLDRYTKAKDGNTEIEYFTLNRTTGSNNYADLYTRAINSSGQLITSTEDVEGGTNTQKGIYQGMNLLATASSTKATINGKEVQRVPAVILLSDGASTYSQTDRNWWAPTGNNRQGPGSSSYYGNGMLAMMTGAYMKAAVDRNYGVTGTAYDTTIYTIGMGVNDLVETDRWGNITDSSDRDLARVTLNPGKFFDDTTNSYAVSIKNAWNNYIGEGTDTTPNITVNGGNRNNSYTLNHPTENDISGDALKTYVDQHYDADDADSIASVFNDIVADIAISTPKVPTEHDAANPTTSGYITYTDPIGEYMEVKDMKAIIYGGHKYVAHDVKTEGNVTTYTFTDTAEGNAVYGSEELSHIIIEVNTTTDDNGIKTQVLTIKIPASLIPLRVNTVHLSGNETTGYTVKSHTNNGAYPIRVFYTVGLQEAVIDKDGIVATSKLDTDYIKANSNTDGTINFYSNLYSGNISPYDSDITVGDATVVFDADESNPFYYMQEDAYIFENEALTIPAKDDELEDAKTYYYKETHYHGTTIEVESLARTGAQLKGNTKVLQDETTGQWYRPAGTVRINRMLLFEGKKVANATNTADDFYTPTYNEATGHFTVYLGNNGVMSAIAGGSLAISKTVDAAEGLTAPADKEFTFTVDLDGATGTYVYEVTNAANEQISTGTIADGGTIQLKDGETATILNLPPDTKYTVTETAMAEFETAVAGSTGSIEAGKTAEADFTNTYFVEPLTFPTEGQSGVSGEKVLSGREWRGTDTFTFVISSSNNAPLPEKTTVTLTGSELSQLPKDKESVAFDFGKITYTVPGTYYYTIVELTPGMAEANRIPGVSYSKEAYDIVVEVTDLGNGKMNAVATMKKVQDTTGQTVSVDATIAQFTNVYTEKAVLFGPVAMKQYTDNSGTNPLVDGMFKFQMTAVTDGAPMPEGTVNGVYTTSNVGNYISFSQMEYTDEDAGKTFVYELREVNEGKVGMTYDDTVITVSVAVTWDSTADAVVVTPTYSNNKTYGEFTNSYTPNPVTLGDGTNAPIQGTKTLTGRKMKNGESFEFTITPASAAMNQAVREGSVVMPNDTTASVSGGEDGEAVAFAFDKITFTKPGVYTFNVSESVPEAKAGGVTYDEHVCTVTVNVTDNNGQLEAVVSYDNGIDATDKTKAVFANTYEATFDENTAISLSGTKNMTGRPIEEGEFYFEVALDNGARATYVPAGPDDTADDKGVYESTIQLLDKITYTEAGEYVYYINEIIPDPVRGGMDYDETTYRVTVKVTDDTNGTLSAAITEIAKSEDGTNYEPLNTGEAIVFTNVYTTTPKEIALLDITKVISGTRGEELQAGEFTFEVSLVSGDETGVTLPSETRVTNRADGSVVFGDLTFSKVGTYVIKIEEVVPTGATENEDGTYIKDGITYSTNVIQSTFHVTDNLDGTLSVTRTGTTGSRKFVNAYHTTGTLVGSTELVVTKVFTGRENNAWTDEDIFSFVLSAGDEKTTTAIADGKIVLPSNADGITVDKDDADKEVAFGDIVFYEAGTFTFIVREEAGEVPGVDYDATARIVTVTATDNSDGTLTVTASGNETEDLTFKNTYNPNDVLLYGHGNLHVTKEFTGREGNEWLDTDSFTFTLGIDESDAATKTAFEAGNLVIASGELTIDHNNKDHAHFGNITFKQKGTFRFVVKEVKGSIPGVVYDESTKTIIVNVTDNGDGTMAVAIDASSDALTFSNEYQPDSVDLIGQTNLKITKAISGREWAKEDAFKFKLEAGDEFTVENAVMSQTEITVTNQGDKMTAVDEHTVETYFGNVTLKEAGVYRFRILEGNSENTDNMAYDRHSTVVIVTVEHDYEEGELVVTDVTYIGTMTWINTHTPNAINITLTGEKVLNGRTLTAGDKFNFTIEVAEDFAENTPMPYVISLQNLMSDITFGPITFTKEGTYKYIIRENGIIAGVTNDTGYVVATVKVTHNGDSGEFEYDTSYQKMNAAGEVIGTEFKFVNTYSSAGTLAGKTNLKVTKNFTGRADDAWLDSDEFTFTLAADSEHAATVNAVKDGYIVLPTETTLVVNKTNKDDVYFGDILFTKEGTYQFTVAETKGNIAGITYDSVPKKVIVNVIDKGDGTMAVALTSSSNVLTFTNTYEAKSITATLEGIKIMSGRDMKDTDIYDFTISAADGTPMPANTTVKNNATTGAIVFEPITYTEAGTYVYEIAESGGSAAGVTDVTKKVTATVTVVDENVGQLEVTSIEYSVAGENGFVYTNEYKAAPTDPITIPATKKVTPTGANTYEMEGGEFRFEVEPAKANPSDDPIEQHFVTNAADGVIAFAEDVQFTQPGTYKYTLHEVDGTKGGITYDASVYHITVEVTDVDAKLQAKVSITKGDKKADEIVFDNGYTPRETTALIHGHKLLESEHIDLAAGVFQFKLEAIGDNADRTPMPAEGGELARNEETGLFQFGIITYTEAGTFEYQITEVDEGKEGYTYDNAQHVVTVTVTDEGGELKATVNGLTDENDLPKVVFTNGYVPSPVKLQGETALKGKKNLDGRDMKADEFEFQLLDKDSQVVAEAKNDANGNFALEPLEFTKAGTYYYTIVEVDTELGGVTYDDTVYTVKIEVTDAGGHLEADVTYLKDGQEAELVFENNYKAQPVGIRISAAKALSGRELKAGEFTFLLKNAAGEVVAKATNDADGLIVFEEIKYDVAGTYTYTISEEKGNAEHVTYDDSVYKVTVTVTDDNAGTMNANVDYHGVNPAFNNSYEEPQSVIPTGDFAGILPTVIMMLLAAGFITMSMKKRHEEK